MCVTTMKNILFTSTLLVVLSINVSAFSDTIISRPEHEVAYDIFEFDNFYLIAGIIHITPDPAAYLIKLSKEGKVICDTIINPGSRYSKILRVNDDIVLFGLGWTITNGQYITYTRMDTSLNLIQEKHLRLPQEIHYLGRFDVTHRTDSIFFLAGIGYEADTFPSNTLPLLYLVTNEGDSLAAKVLPGALNIMRECNNSLQTTYMNCALVSDLKNDHQSTSAIIADNNLAIWDTITFGSYLFRDLSVLYLNDTFFMFYRTSVEDRMLLSKFNYSGQLHGQFAVCAADLQSSPALQSSLDIWDGRLFYLGMRGLQPYGGVWGTGRSSHLIAGCTDTRLNQQWQREIGGDYYYLPMSIKATSDGGCLLTGILNDTINHNNKSDIFIIKLDAFGESTFISHIDPIDNYVELFPNPCKETLNIRSVDPHDPITKISVYSISGHLMDKLTVSTREMVINTGTYPAGTFVVYGETDAGRLFCRKFIKVE